VSFDSRLLGAWNCTHEEDDPISARVYAFSDREYYISAGVDDDWDHLRAFPTRVDGSRFISFQFLGFGPPGPYTIVGYDFDSPTSVSLRIADVGVGEAKPRTQEALNSFVSRRLANGSLFDEDDVLICNKVALPTSDSDSE
jgi:hypothetical protein